jgi:hypothetical protein
MILDNFHRSRVRNPTCKIYFGELKVNSRDEAFDYLLMRVFLSRQPPEKSVVVEAR